MSGVRRCVLAGAALLLAGCGADSPAPRADRVGLPVRPRTSRSTPAPTAPAPTLRERPPTTRLLVVGDIMLGRGVAVPEAPASPLRFMADRIRSADLAVGNLESTLSDDGPPQQPATTRSPPRPARCPGWSGWASTRCRWPTTTLGDFGVPRHARHGRPDPGRAGSCRSVRARDLAAREPARGARARRGPVRLRRLQRDRRDPAGHPRLTGRAVGPDAAAHRAAAAVRPRPRHRRRGAARPPGRRRGGAPPLGRPVRPRRRAGPVAGRPGAGAGRRRPRRRRPPARVQGLEPVGEAVVAHSLGNFVFDMDFLERHDGGRHPRPRPSGATGWSTSSSGPTGWAPTSRRGRSPGAAAAAILADVREHSRGRFARR